MSFVIRTHVSLTILKRMKTKKVIYRINAESTNDLFIGLQFEYLISLYLINKFRQKERYLWYIGDNNKKGK
jgi:hypothetical protein